MSDAAPTMSVPRFALKAACTLLGVVGFVACLAVLFLCARAVMDIGGSCASGGPYVVANPCPDGVAWLTPVSIFAGLASLLWLAIWNSGLPGPKLALLAWPALFLTLGWNFWEYGLNSPHDGGVEVGWIVCGVLFVLMGGLPLLAFLSPAAWKATFWADVSESRTKPTISSTTRTILQATRPPSPRRAASPPRPAPAPNAPTTGDASTDLVADLQHLDDLHRSGALNDDEFAAAKQRLLRQP